MDTWHFDSITGNVITYDGRLDGALNEDGTPATDPAPSGGNSGNQSGNTNP
jgi:hypothetical protein